MEGNAVRHDSFGNGIVTSLDDNVITGPDLLKTLRTDLTGLAGFTDYLCAAVDLEF